MSQHGTARTRFDRTALYRRSHTSDCCLGLAVLINNVVRGSKRTTIRLTSPCFFKDLGPYLKKAQVNQRYVLVAFMSALDLDLPFNAIP